MENIDAMSRDLVWLFEVAFHYNVFRVYLLSPMLLKSDFPGDTHDDLGETPGTTRPPEHAITSFYESVAE